jgi:predicted polyphosphate/ATP-dependent NAD kinase
MSAGSGRRLGLLVNPIAGMGGRVALKGTDGPGVLAEARQRGARPLAAQRARRALEAIARVDRSIELLAAPGVMGEELAAEVGLSAQPTGLARSGETTAHDTWVAARAMLEAGVDLLLFAGGDGTARDIHDAVDGGLPVLGIPTGVKMHSGLFAATPTAAGEVAARFLAGPETALVREADVADIDEASVREGHVTARLYGVVRVPSAPAVLGAKAGHRPADAGLDALCTELAAQLEPAVVYVFGPGTTTGRVLAALGLEATVLGVDAVRDGELIGRDLDEASLLALLSPEREPNLRLVLGVIGGQGSLLGRGNQQLSPEVMRRIGRERITILASEDKLAALAPMVLRVDTGDDLLDRELSGYVRVHVAPRRTMIVKVTS